MATELHPVSTLNPNAPLFVPAAFRIVEDFSNEWWSLVQTCPDFREQWVRERLPALEEQQRFEADLEEIADLDNFLELQEEMEEQAAAAESLYFDDHDRKFALLIIVLQVVSSCRRIFTSVLSILMSPVQTLLSCLCALRVVLSVHRSSSVWTCTVSPLRCL